MSASASQDRLSARTSTPHDDDLSTYLATEDKCNAPVRGGQGRMFNMDDCFDSSKVLGWTLIGFFFWLAVAAIVLWVKGLL